MDRELRRDSDRVDVNREVDVDRVVVGRERNNDKTAAESGAVGTFTEAAGGIAAIVLGILGLAGIVPATLAAVGVIVIGAALLTEGMAVLAEFAQLSQTDDGSARDVAGAGGGVMLEFLSGIGVIVLGVLALLNVANMTLLAVSIVAVGGTLILAGGMLSTMATSNLSGQNHTGDQMARNAAAGTRGLEILIGIGGVVLGILALVGINQLTFILVSVLGFGSAILLTGSAITGRLLAIMSR